MTTPSWIKKACVRSIIIAIVFIFLIVACSQLIRLDVFSSSASPSRDKERQEFSKTNSLKTLVEAWFKGELCRQLYSLSLSLDLLMKLMSWKRFDTLFETRKKLIQDKNVKIDFLSFKIEFERTKLL